MINVVVPLAGPNLFFDDSRYPYPKPLIEIGGDTMIELFLKNIRSIEQSLKFIFIVNEEDCKKYHLDFALNILTNNECKLVKLKKETKGAACSVLMGIEYINNEDPLIIANADQLLDVDFNEILLKFSECDAGVITFESIHPRWSYVKIDNNKIIETAEKKPLSNQAIAGFYYFSKGKSFIEGAMDMIRKDASVEDKFYVAPVFNELVLKNMNLLACRIDNKRFHTFYTPQKIEEYERVLSC